MAINIILLVVAVLLAHAIILKFASEKFDFQKFWPFYASLLAIVFAFYVWLKPNITFSSINGILIGVLAIVVICLPLFALEARESKKSSRQFSADNLVKDIFAVPIEEFIFRGILFGLLLSYGLVLAIIISSLVFVLWHLNFNKQFLIVVFISAIGFTVLYVVTNSILAPIMLHAGLNIGEYTIKPIFIRKFKK